MHAVHSLANLVPASTLAYSDPYCTIRRLHTKVLLIAPKMSVQLRESTIMLPKGEGEIVRFWLAIFQ